MMFISDRLDEIIYQAKEIKDNIVIYKQALMEIRKISNNYGLTVSKRNEEITKIIDELLGDNNV